MGLKPLRADAPPHVVSPGWACSATMAGRAIRVPSGAGVADPVGTGGPYRRQAQCARHRVSDGPARPRQPNDVAERVRRSRTLLTGAPGPAENGSFVPESAQAGSAPSPVKRTHHHGTSPRKRLPSLRLSPMRALFARCSTSIGRKNDENKLSQGTGTLKIIDIMVIGTASDDGFATSETSSKTDVYYFRRSQVFRTEMMGMNFEACLSARSRSCAAKRARSQVRRYGGEAAFLEAMSANALAQQDGRMGDYSWKWLDWARVAVADRCTPGRAYAKIVTARETFFVGYNRSAGHLIEQAAGTMIPQQQSSGRTHLRRRSRRPRFQRRGTSVTIMEGPHLRRRSQRPRFQRRGRKGWVIMQLT